MTEYWDRKQARSFVRDVRTVVGDGWTYFGHPIRVTAECTECGAPLSENDMWKGVG